MASDTYHEPFEKLSERTRNMHRAIVSLMEELEAVDWYQQRVDETEDPALKDVLQHNADEEKEHAAMVLEWIRRNDPVFDQMLRTYLFTSAEITEVEEAAEAGEGAPKAAEAAQTGATAAVVARAATPPPLRSTMTVGGLKGR